MSMPSGPGTGVVVHAPRVAITPPVNGYLPGIHTEEVRRGEWQVFKIDSQGAITGAQVEIKQDPATGRYHFRPDSCGPWSRAFPDGGECGQRAVHLIKAMHESDGGLVSFIDTLHQYAELMHN